MKISVSVIPLAHKNSVEVCDDGTYKVRTTVAPEHGKANESVQKILATHFDVPKSSVRILYGATARIKIIEIDV